MSKQTDYPWNHSDGSDPADVNCDVYGGPPEEPSPGQDDPLRMASGVYAGPMFISPPLPEDGQRPKPVYAGPPLTFRSPCPDCGAPVPAGIPFCAKCGASLTERVTPPESVCMGPMLEEEKKQHPGFRHITSHFCPDCGALLTDGDRICVKCGASLPERVTPPVSVYMGPPPEKEKKQHPVFKLITQYFCPCCGARVSKKCQKCPDCGTWIV